MKPVDLEKLTALVDPVVGGQGYELVDLEWKNESGWVLRVFIDRQGGVSLDDCAKVSHQLSAVLDVADAIGPAYSLEVSSPGLDRPLKKEADFARFVGKNAKIRTREPIADGAAGRRNFAGKLLEVHDGVVRIDVGDRAFDVPVAAVEKAHLVYDFKSEQG
jgi:ribosome maturation factor RimP